MTTNNELPRVCKLSKYLPTIEANIPTKKGMLVSYRIECINVVEASAGVDIINLALSETERIVTERERAKVVKKFPAKKVLAACKLIEEADDRAMCVDGPIGPTASELTSRQIQQCLTALWMCRDFAASLNPEAETPEQKEGG